jgi:hypothetical protein
MLVCQKVFDNGRGVLFPTAARNEDRDQQYAKADVRRRVHVPVDASLPLHSHRGLEFLINEPNFFKEPAIASQSRFFCLTHEDQTVLTKGKMMKAKDNRVPTQFAAATRFAPPILAAVSFRGAVETELDQLKNRLLARELARTTTLEQNVGLRRAANEAAALVWLTPYPLLLLPLLFEEKVRAARIKTERQALIRERSHELLTLAE